MGCPPAMADQRLRPSSFRVLTYDRLQLLMTLLQGALLYKVSMMGRIPISDHRFSIEPHHGDVNRTYLLPERERA